MAFDQPRTSIKIMKTSTYVNRLLLTGGLMATVLGGAVLSGCASRTSVQTNQSASVGQQLQDLDKAYKEGIIDQKEYERLKKSLIKKND
jgi:hypothetical protein